MRKYILSLLFFCAVLLITSCVKDKGFDDNKYGIKNPNSNVAVSIPLSVKGINLVGVNFVTTSQSFDVFGVQLESENTAATDIHVNLVPNAALVSAYNSANATNLVALPTSSYAISNLKVTIPAGSKTAYLKIVIPNASTLNPLLTYGLGFTIGSIDEAGISIPANMKNIVVQFNVKNKYDGVYSLNLRLDGWDAYGIASGVAGDYPAKFELITAGPDAVTINALAPSSFADLQPGFTGGVGNIIGATGFGAAGPKYIFNSTTDKVSSVVNTYPDDGRGRVFYLDPSSTTSQYTPSSKQIKVEYFLKQNGRPDQKITAIYTYVRAR